MVFKPTWSCVRDRDAPTVPGRHMKQIDQIEPNSCVSEKLDWNIFFFGFLSMEDFKFILNENLSIPNVF